MLIRSFLFSLIVTLGVSGCYTQFGVVKRDRDYTERERVVVEERVYTDDSDEYYEDAYYEDEYYEDETYREVRVTEYEYYVQPVVYRYRFRVYDPWYYAPPRHHYRPRWHVSVRWGWDYYDPYYGYIHCGPSDYWYYDPWDYHWAYPVVIYTPYPGYYGGYWGGYYGGYYDYGPGYHHGHRGRYYDNPRHKQRKFADNSPSNNPVRRPRFTDDAGNSPRVGTVQDRPTGTRPARSPRPGGTVADRTPETVERKPQYLPGGERPARPDRKPNDNGKDIKRGDRNQGTKTADKPNNRPYDRKYYDDTKDKSPQPAKRYPRYNPAKNKPTGNSSGSDRKTPTYRPKGNQAAPSSGNVDKSSKPKRNAPSYSPRPADRSKKDVKTNNKPKRSTPKYKPSKPARNSKPSYKPNKPATRKKSSYKPSKPSYKPRSSSPKRTSKPAVRSGSRSSSKPKSTSRGSRSGGKKRDR